MGFALAPTLSVTQSQPFRIIGEVYQNTTSAFRIVIVVPQSWIRANDGSLIGWALWDAYCDATDDPTTIVSETYLQTQLSGLTVGVNEIWSFHSLVFVVPKNYYYKITREDNGDGSVGAIIALTEYDIG